MRDWYTLRLDHCPVPAERATNASELLEVLVRRSDGSGRYFGDWRMVRTLFWDQRQDELDDQLVMSWLWQLVERRDIVIIEGDLSIGWGMEPGAPVLYIQHRSRWQRFQKRRFIPAAVRREVMDRDGFVCALCAATEDLALDHVVPFSHNGPDTVDNLRVLCRPCNSRRGNRV